MHESDLNLPAGDIRLKTFGFLLIDGFSLMSYASAVEPLRAANILSGRRLYRWRHVSIDATPAKASNGARVVADAGVGDAVDLDALFICAGGDPSRFQHRGTLAWLRALARRKVLLGGISGGPFILAQAGVLGGHRCTIHWEHFSAFRDCFSELDARQTLFEIDAGRLTCAGGAAAFDLMTRLIEMDHGAVLAAAIRDWFISPGLRIGEAEQRPFLAERISVDSQPVSRAAAHMTAHLETPATRATIAAAAGVGPRQLERLFLHHLGVTPGAYYLGLRLDEARRLVRQTRSPILDLAVACGFASLSHFSRTYRARFGRSPSADRLVHDCI